MKLRPYHNPEKVDESKVPAGWRFLYAYESGKVQNPPCRMWFPDENAFNMRVTALGNEEITYIVPVNA